MSENKTNNNYIKIDIKRKKQIISKKTKTIYLLFEKWKEDYETYLYTAIPICNEIDKLKKEVIELYNNSHNYTDDDNVINYYDDEEYEKKWDDADRKEWERD
jgi:hypothetical protein|tara:strand:+ start:196 stop:501 length:306 start_codon:yes stop_codon:yes gene_type:complete